MKIYDTTKYSKFLKIIRTFDLRDYEFQTLMDKASNVAIPDAFRFNYNDLILGKLVSLQNIKNGGELFTTAPFIVLEDANDNKLKKWWRRRKFFKISCLQALAFVNNMNKELERISKAFDSIQIQPTKEEVRAGANKINGSIHDIAIWYAMEMGISDVNLVYEIKWPIIWALMKRQNEDIKLRRLMAEQRSKEKRK